MSYYAAFTWNGMQKFKLWYMHKEDYLLGAKFTCKKKYWHCKLQKIKGRTIIAINIWQIALHSFPLLRYTAQPYEPSFSCNLRYVFLRNITYIRKPSTVTKLPTTSIFNLATVLSIFTILHPKFANSSWSTTISSRSTTVSLFSASGQLRLSPTSPSLPWSGLSHW